MPVGHMGLNGNRLTLPAWVVPAAFIVIGAGFLLRALVDRRPKSIE